MRLAFIGSQSTGKSTLVSRFSRDFDNVVVIHEIARTIIAEGWPLGKRASVTSYSLYIKYQLERERASRDCPGTHLISDRCLVDLAAYGRINDRLTEGFFPPHFVDAIAEIGKLSCQTYDAFIFFPIEFPQVEDGVRDSDEIYRQLVSDEIRSIADEWGLLMHEVTGSVDERYDQVRSLGGM